jgi:Asp/Glu/hydantoin racemase
MTAERLMHLARKLTFIHTVASLEPMFANLAQERLDDWDIASIIDESMLARTIAKGQVDQETVGQLAGHVRAAKDGGSNAIVVTCSTLGELVDRLAARTATPIYRIDRGMAEKAISQASTIGVLATLPTTLRPTTRLLRSTADRMGRRCKFVPRLTPDAFACLRAGDPDVHDALVRRDYEVLSGEVDLVVLAQASMARALQNTSLHKPYLTSPELGMDHIAGSLRMTRMSED